MKYKITHTTKYSHSEPVPVCHNVVHFAPRDLQYQTCEKFQLMIHPEPFEIRNRLDYFGNHASYFSIDHAHRALTVSATSDVNVLEYEAIAAAATPPWETVVEFMQHSNRSDATLDAYQYAFPTLRTEPFAALAAYTKESFLPKRPILEASLDLTKRIHQDFGYDPRATTVQTPIRDVFEDRRGVCQDFAHLQLGCLRALGLASRYVSGYLRTHPPAGKPRLIGADASHAWVSVFCGEQGWVDLDPTNNVRTSTDHITLAWGRDYDDVCPIQGVIVGDGEHRMSVSVDVAPEEPVTNSV